MGAPRFVLDRFWPSNLFLGGIPGAWYDPTDLSTMFQDSAGTTPVTAVEQPVGLILDKSQGLALGAELVTNGDFSGGTTGWSVNAGATLSVSGGVLRVTTAAGGVAYVTQSFATTVGKTYRVEATIVTLGPGFTGVRKSDNATASSNVVTIKDTTGAGSGVFVATAATTFIVLQSNTVSAGQFAEFDNISVRELAGNHASQSTAASRPTYRARYNLLTYSEQFDNGAWSKAGATVSANSTVAPDGTMTADTLTESAATSDHFTWQNLPLATTAARYTASVYAKYSGRFIILVLSNAVSGDAYAYFDLQNGVISQAAATTGAMWSSATATIENVGSGWYRCTLTATKDATGNAQPQVRTSDVGTGGSSRSYAGNGTSGAFLWGAQILTAADVTATGNAYQRIAAATVYDTAPIFRPYLAFDGVDDGLATAAITPGTDKCQVFSGLANIAGTNFAIVAEMSANAGSNNGSALLYSPDNVLANFYGFLSRGTINVAVATNNAAFRPPAINVVSGLGDISGDVATLRVNGAQIVTSGSDQGTGNYLSYPLYIGRRGGVSAPFNGRVYSLILRFGANLSASEISETELWVNARCGAY